MSAVMSTLSMISGGRRAHRKLASSARKSGQLSDAGEDRSRPAHDLTWQQRSASLQTLEVGGGGVNLDSLEAKMASIEVSLGAQRRRSGIGARDSRDLDALRAALTDKDSLIQSLKKQLSASLSAARLAAQAAASPKPAPGGGGGGGGGGGPEECAALSAEERRALDERAAAVRADLDARRHNIQELRRRLDHTHVTENIDTRIQQAELQYKLGREELELLSLGEQARALAQLLDHADAAARRHQRATLYSTVREYGGTASLVSAEAREGSWGANPRGSGLAIDCTGDHTALRPGDRLVEVNGTVVVSCRSLEELQNALGGGGGSEGGSPSRLVVLRPQTSPPSTPPTHAHNATFTQNEAAALREELDALRAAAEAAERAKRGLRADNTRLTHRISYLEDQVAEMITRHAQLQPTSSTDSSCITVNKTKKNVTNISITSEPAPRRDLQVFQKGPGVTALVPRAPAGESAALPVLRPRSGAEGRSSPRARLRPASSHHCVRAAADYGAETDAAIRMIERNQRHIERQRLKAERLEGADYAEMAELAVRGPGVGACAPRRPDADRPDDPVKKTNWAERKTLSIIEQLKRSQRMRKLKKNESAEDVRADSEDYLARRIDGKVLENAHKSSRRSSKSHSRSARSSEFESECSDFPAGDAYGSETCSTRLGHYRKHDERRDVGGRPAPPAPPRKPLRLSLHKARSAHSLAGSESEGPSRPPSAPRCEPRCEPRPDASKRPVKRTHAADRWAREEPSRGTPRPARRHPDGLTPAADDLYPDNAHSPSAVRWC